MKKWILVVGLALVGVAAAVTWKTQFDTRSSDSNDLLAYVPADTVYFFGGESSQELADFFGELPSNIGSTPTQAAQLDALLNSWDTSNSAPGKFFKFLVDKTRQPQYQTINALLDSFGVSFVGPYALYSHGIAPVLRVQIKSKSTFDGVINEAIADSGWIPQTQTVEEKTIRLWEISSHDAAVQLYFVISSGNDDLTVTLVSSNDDDATKWERLGLTKPANDITTTEEIAQLQQRYNFTDAMTGFIHFERIATAFLHPEKNTFGQQLQLYLPEDVKADMNQRLTPACRKDFATLAAAMPRFVVGYDTLDVKNKHLSAHLNSVWEINNSQVTQELKSIRGHIPQHALDASDKIAYFGVGLSFDKLTPALTNLWNLFVNADYSCEQLIQAQTQARETNPAMLAMFLGMTQGIEGLGLSIYDIEWPTGEAATLSPNRVSALLSISAQNPQTVAGLTAMLPMLGGIQIPADGSAVTLALPMVPPSITVKAAIKGKHLAVYTDDALAPQLAALENETLAANGLYSFGVNYRRFEAFTKLNIGGFAGAQSCIAQHEFAHMFASMPMDINYLSDASDHGMEARIGFSIDPHQSTQLSLPGSYQLEFLNDQCEWEKAGVESIQENGSGGYIEQDEAAQCALYELEYQWVQQIDRINLTTTKELLRDTCADEPELHEPSEYSCFLLNVTADQFQCLYDPGTPDAALYRYTRQ